MSRRQLLLMANDTELYGVDLATVQEIRVFQPLTRLPHAPDYVIGILNVSGQILPVIDLRFRLWNQKTDIGPWHIIVLVKHGNTQCGILVDAANEIAEFDNAQIDHFATGSGCLSGIASLARDTDETMPVTIIDIAAVAAIEPAPPMIDVVNKEMVHA